MIFLIFDFSFKKKKTMYASGISLEKTIQVEVSISIFDRDALLRDNGIDQGFRGHVKSRIEDANAEGRDGHRHHMVQVDLLVKFVAWAGDGGHFLL